MNDVDANGSRITEDMYKFTQKLIDTPDVRLFANGYQVAQLLLNCRNVEFETVGDELHHFGDVKVFLDPHTPDNEIHFRDKQGQLVARITNLAVPNAGDFEFI